MVDPYANQHAFYDAQDDEVEELWDQDDPDWEKLYQTVTRALSDPFLPRAYRTKFEIIAAYSTANNAGEHLQRARAGVDDMRLVMQAEGRAQDRIDEQLQVYITQIEVAERGLVYEERYVKTSSVSIKHIANLCSDQPDEGEAGSSQSEALPEQPGVAMDESADGSGVQGQTKEMQEGPVISEAIVEDATEAAPTQL